MNATSAETGSQARRRESEWKWQRSAGRWVAMIALLAAHTTAVLAEEAQFRIEVHPISTPSLTTGEILEGKVNGTPVTIGGELRLPIAAQDRLPTVILIHGAGGVYGNESIWADEFNKLGMAVFVLDSFTGRGFVDSERIVGQMKGAAAVSGFVMIGDAYRALALLSKHPRIDPTRIALMGFSRGGITALYASLDRFHRPYAPPDVTFAAYVALYPLCNYALDRDGEVSSKPIRIFHGTDDDLTPAAPCRTYVERLRRAGKDVQMTEYPGAFHAFDLATLGGARNYPDLRSFARCFFEERAAGTLVNRETGLPPRIDDSCVSPGGTLGYNANAHAASTQFLREFFRATFGLR